MYQSVRHAPEKGAALAAPRLSVVIPFFNEESASSVLIPELRTALEPCESLEVLLINDGSHDDTGRVLDEAASAWAAVRVVHFSENQGQGPALLLGIYEARGDVIALLDGDGQNDPADLPALVAALDEADFVTGYRARRQDSRLRRWMSRFANTIRSRVLRDGVRDAGCGLKAFRRGVRESFVPLKTLYSFLPAMARAAGFRVIERPVAHRPRTLGTSKYGLGVMLWRPLIDMLGMAWFIRRRGASPSLITQRRTEAAQ